MKNQPKRVVVIGSGFSGLSAATHCAQLGMKVTVLERHAQAGGRARTWQKDGFLFDMGPSWYWMPDVFESYFNQFGSSVAQHYDLVRLSPSYRVFLENEELLDIPSELDELFALFESIETGSAAKLKQFLAEAEYKYKVGMQDLVRLPGRSLREYLEPRIMGGVFRLHMLRSMRSYVRKSFKDPRLIQLLEFPVLFLGARPQNIPALYSMMNYADMALGTWYPMGGMHRIIRGMQHVAEQQGVEFKFQHDVLSCEVTDDQITTVRTQNAEFKADIVVASADYHHVETKLIPQDKRSYSDNYWESRTIAPSAFIYYLGINKRLDGLLHHNLFFDRDFDKHADEIYKRPRFPTDPLMYVCVPSKTDPTVAPAGSENLFVLIPTAPGIADTPAARAKYLEIALGRIAERCGEDLHDHIVVERSYAHNDFVKDYSSFKGNAYGLANTLRQTGILKPSIKSKRLKNLYYTGQLSVPGPGVPPSLISGGIVAREIHKEWN